MKRIVALIVTVALAFTVTVAPISAGDLPELEQQLIEETKVDPMATVGFKEDTSWTFWNKVWGISAVGLYGIGDTGSTIYQLSGDSTCNEANPLFGEDPSPAVLIGAKAAIFGLAYWYTEHFTAPERRQRVRNFVYAPIAVLGGAVTAHNMSLDCH